MSLRLATCALLTVGLAYPFVLYADVGASQAHLAPLVLAALWGVRSLTRHPDTLPHQRSVALTMCLLCLLIGVIPGATAPLFYPVLVNATFGLVFGSSLARGPSLIEQIAVRHHGPLDVLGRRHTRRATQAWTVFFVLNGLCCAALALWAPRSWWTLYTGIIAYVLMGILFATEWLLRPATGRKGLRT